MRFVFLLLLLCASLARGAEPDLLEPDKAFRFSARLKDAHSIEVNYQIAPGYYLYRDKFRFALTPAEAKPGAANFPAGVKHKDEFFGEVETYRGNLSFVLPFELAKADVPAIRVAVTSQGCADVGVCYIPYEQKAELKLAALASSAPRSDAQSSPVDGQISRPAAAAGGDDDRAAAILGGSFWLAMVTFFIGGLLLSFTPCVLPMVPILSGIIIGTGRSVTRTKGLLLAAVYVLGMAITYAAAGVAAGLSGAMLSATLQNPWVLGAFAAIFVLLALSMFGFYELQLPAALQSGLSGASNRLPGGQGLGVFAMGVLSALIVGPCVAAPLAGALL